MTEPHSDMQRLLTAAAEARRRGAAAEELRSLDEAVRRFPADPRAQNARGMRALADRQPAIARDRFREASRLDPAEPALWMNLATADRALADDAAERVSLHRALAINQLNFMAQLRLAELEQRCDRHPEAVTGWTAVLQMAAQMPDLPTGLVAVLDDARRYLATRSTAMETAINDRVGALLQPGGQDVARFQACVDHIYGRRPIYQNQCAGVHFPFLPAVEYFDRTLFPWFAELETSTNDIRDEALALLQRGADQIRPYVRQDPGTPENKWSPLDGSLDWSACFLWEYGRPNDAVCGLCPKTAAALARVPQNIIPGKAPSAFFSVLRPGAHIPAHTGVTNTRAIIHLPLVVPQGCRFRVGGETREWEVGKAFAFDDTIEHEAWNDSDQIRIVLILDTWNPFLTPLEHELLKGLFDATT
jgi:aspartate beta-hydroxylase